MNKMRLGWMSVAPVALLTMTACAPSVPDSGAGVGFTDYTQYELDRAQREAALTGGNGAQTAITSDQLAASGIVETPGVVTSTTATNSTGEAVLANGRVAGQVEAQPGNTAPVLLNNPGISDEQDFSAVSGRETIQSDADRRAAQAAAYQIVEATDVPIRSGDTGPNIIQYALQTTNAKGETLYSRSGISGQNRFLRNCAEYQSPDAAQRDFLARGGPQRDRRGLDPDGDGFACGWDPVPYRVIAAAPVVPAPAAVTSTALPLAGN